MIILDTNVVSAFMRPDIETRVSEWLDGMPKNSIWTTSVTIFEIRLGIERLPQGRRRRSLELAFADAIEKDFDGQVFPFENSAAHEAAIISAEQRRIGRSIDVRDAQIAGIAKARNIPLATRNVKHFDGVGLVLINPWSS